MSETHAIRFRGRTYYSSAPELTPQEIDQLLGAERTPGTRLIMVRGASARPVVGRVVIQDAGLTQLEEIPQATEKGGWFSAVKDWCLGTGPRDSAAPSVTAPPAAVPRPTPQAGRAAAAQPGASPRHPGSVPAVAPPASVVGNMTQRELFIKAQVASIAEVYGERYGIPVQLDRDLQYLFLPRFPLPRRWGERETPLLIHLPPHYPATPPNGFFLSARCRGPHIFSGQAFAGRIVHGGTASVDVPGWNWYCVHCHQGWTPGRSPLEPMNLWTFLRVVQTALSVNEF